MMQGRAQTPASSPWQRLRGRLGPLVRTVIPSRLPLKGPYASHAEALAEATGYDCPEVPRLVEEATRAVLEGRAAYERDGTAFATRPELPIHAALRPWLDARSTIADFGGGLGGLYHNAPDLFPPGCRKIVIEQASMVEVGRRLARHHGFSVEFMDATREVIPAVDVLIFSSVLQYLSDPWYWVETLLARSTPTTVIVDRTAIQNGPSRWFLQTNPGYYRQPVTYPVQVLNQQHLLNAFPSYRALRRWHNTFDPDRPEHIGLLLLKNAAAAEAAG